MSKICVFKSPMGLMAVKVKYDAEAKGTWIKILELEVTKDVDGNRIIEIEVPD